MSFSLEFNASSVARAREVVAEAELPDDVARYLMLGLDGIQALNDRDAKLSADGKHVIPVLGLSVKAVGHLCAAGNSYEVTTAQIEVRRIFAR